MHARQLFDQVQQEETRQKINRKLKLNNYISLIENAGSLVAQKCSTACDLVFFRKD